MTRKIGLAQILFIRFYPPHQRNPRAIIFLKRMVMRKSFLLFTFFLLLFSAFTPPEPSYHIALLKYGGGGDWYANKTSLPNLIGFCNKHLNTNIFPEEG